LARQRKGPGSAPDDSEWVDPLENETDSEEGDDRSGGIPDIFRRMMALGFSGLFTTEAAIRGALGDTVPREWVDFVTDQSERTRAELTQRFAEEFGRMLEKVDVVELAEQLLEGRTIEVKAQFRLGPRDADDSAEEKKR
jgi:hypothetical protein